MKVLILSNMYPSPAKPYAGIFVKNQVDLLREIHGDKVIVTCRAMPRRFTGAAGSVAKYLLFFIRCIPDFFRRYDVVHVHFFIPTALIGFIYRVFHRSSRLVVTFHGGDVVDSQFKGWKGEFWRRISKKVDCGITVGPNVEIQVAKHLCIGNTVLQSAGVDSRHFYPPTESAHTKIHDFVFAGSFVHRKGIDLLVEALQARQFSDVQTVFIGTGPLRHLIEPLVEESRAQILDHLTQDEMREVFWDSKFIVLPSRSEPFGLVVSEALYCGVPAIISDEPGLLMQVSEDRNGFVFKKGSADGLAQCLSRALELGDEDYHHLSACAEISNRDFDIFTVVDDLIAIYQSLLSGSYHRTPVQ